MIPKKEYIKYKNWALEYFDKSHLVIREDEKEKVEVADFGLSDLENFCIMTLTFFNTERISAKVIVVPPRRICPEHWHPPVGNDPGKEEIMRLRWGTLYLYVEGEPTLYPKAILPEYRRKYFTVWHEIVMRPGDQYYFKPGIKHWFQAGDEGAVIDDYSTCSRDALDQFTDPDIVRIPVIKEE